MNMDGWESYREEAGHEDGEAIPNCGLHIGGVDLVRNSLECKALLYQGQGEAIGRET